MLRFLNIIRTMLLTGGSISLLLGLLSGGAALLSSIDRVRHGHGLLFADDVEIFGLLALICCVLGAFSLIVAKRLTKRMHQQRP
jgi:hypothetical protein